MSELHIRQISAALHTHFDGLIDMADYDSRPPEEAEQAFLSRSLSAFVLAYLTTEAPKDLAASVTDGADDNGIDAVYFHPSERVLYVAQSKWKGSGRGSLNRGDAQKFLTGFRDLINARWDRFNTKIQAMGPGLESALNDASTRFVLVIATTGQEPLSDDVKRDVQDTLDDLNNPTELVALQVLRQGDVYSAVSQGVEGAPIDLDVALYEWGQMRDPFAAYYGQVAASDLADWHGVHQSRLFAPNIRMFLGPTDVNSGIVETLIDNPESVWYFNNGITALCRTIAKKPIGGATRETGIFECKDLRIVNGAQTVGAIAQAYQRSPASVEGARVTIRIIALQDCPVDFERDVTRFNNTQNRIDRRDFVSLDPQQERLRGELQLEGVQYVYKSGDSVASTAGGFDLTEATVARACRQRDSTLAVQAKREIGRLWDDIDQPPYRLLFNPTLTGPKLWRQVLIVRAVERALATHRKDDEGRKRLLAVHGNRFLTHLVMEALSDDIVDGDASLEGGQEKLITGKAEAVYRAALKLLNDLYPDSYLGSLFKNASKCKHLKEQYERSV